MLIIRAPNSTPNTKKEREKKLTLTLTPKSPKEEGREGEEKLCAARHWGPRLEPGTYHMLDKSPQLHPTKVRQASLSVPIDRLW